MEHCSLSDLLPHIAKIHHRGKFLTVGHIRSFVVKFDELPGLSDFLRERNKGGRCRSDCGLEPLKCTPVGLHELRICWRTVNILRNFSTEGHNEIKHKCSWLGRNQRWKSVEVPLAGAELRSYLPDELGKAAKI